MPRITDETRARKRVEILAGAARCFARDGFQAASIDAIVAECGLSSAGALYRYFSGKDELIAAVVEANLSTADEVFDELLAGGSAPSPSRVIATVVDAAASRGAHQLVTGADTGRLVIHVWSEALRQPGIGALTEDCFTRLRAHFGEAARRWRDAGHLPRDADPTYMGAVLLGITHALLVQHHLVPGTDATRYLAAVDVLLARSAGEG